MRKVMLTHPVKCSVLVAGLALAAASPGATQNAIEDIGLANPVLPLHTSGGHIVDANGVRAPLHVVSWYGAESKDYVVGGLQTASLSTIIQQIRAGGFNVVRLPWSNEMYEKNPIVPSYALTANPSMQGLTAMVVFDQIVNALMNANIMVILDNHNSDAEWCCGDDGNYLWYNSRYPESN